MRSSVLQAESLSRSVAEELDFLENYIRLMHGRMPGVFQYSIRIGEDVDLTWQVPKMITQIFAENAVKHGLKPRQNGGILAVRIQHAGESLSIEIEDNGIGRKSAAVNGERGTGKGTSLIEQTIRIINRFNHRKIQLTIADLEDVMGTPRGTLVTILVPAGINYRFYEH